MYRTAIRAPHDVGHGATLILLAVLHGAVRYSQIMDATGYGKGQVYDHLHTLRAAGLVSFEDHKKGTLRPVVVPVAFG